MDGMADRECRCDAVSTTRTRHPGVMASSGDVHPGVSSIPTPTEWQLLGQKVSSYLACMARATLQATAIIAHGPTRAPAKVVHASVLLLEQDSRKEGEASLHLDRYAIDGRRHRHCPPSKPVQTRARRLTIATRLLLDSPTLTRRTRLLGSVSLLIVLAGSGRVDAHFVVVAVVGRGGGRARSRRGIVQ